MHTESFIVYIKTEDIYINNAKDVEKRFNTSNYELERSVPRRKNKVIGLMKHELDGKIMTEFAALTPNTYSYLTDHNGKNEKVNGTKNGIINHKNKIEDSNHCLEVNKLENKINK